MLTLSETIVYFVPSILDEHVRALTLIDALLVDCKKQKQVDAAALLQSIENVMPVSITEARKKSAR